jgi:hypothetical protein
MFKAWEDLSVLEQMALTFWDMYKDAHGFRPRHIDTNGWSEEDFEREFRLLGEVIEQENARRLESEHVAKVRFEIRVQSIIEMGAKDREMALRWIHEAEGSDGDDEYLCYLLGLPYRYFAVDKAAA